MQGLGGALDVAIHLTHELHDIVESNRNPILSTHSDQQTPATRPAVFGVRACFAERAQCENHRSRLSNSMLGLRPTTP
jgi:hypothetical protein